MITIFPYKQTWNDEFMVLGGALRGHLGQLALRIDHIGSTAVAGLAAKDVIDIQITVKTLDSQLEQALASTRYVRADWITHDHMPPGADDRLSDWAKWSFKEPDGQRRTNVHVRCAGKPNQRYALLFRDYLRAHPAASDAYAQVKRELAKRHPKDVEAYYDVKDPVCDIIMEAAEAWAATTQWEAGPTDR